MADRVNEVLESLPVGGNDRGFFTASNGLVLRLKKVQKMIIADANRRMAPPKVPTVWIEDKERSEENPNDPAYIQAVRDYDFDRAMLAMRVYYVLGTEVKQRPHDVEGPEDTGWSDDIMTVDPSANIPESGRGRYMAWLKLYAVPDEDQLRLLNAILRFSGETLEADVKAAQESFRDLEGRDSDNGLSASAEDTRGHIHATDAWDGPGLRSQGSGGVRALPVADVDQHVDMV